MNARSFFTSRKLPAALAVGCAALTGCFSDSGNNSNGDEDRAVISGRIQGDVEANGSGSASGSGWENTLVTVHTINADGSLSAARDSANAQSDGTYMLETDLSGEQELILRGRRADGTEWMTRFKGELKADQTANARPMNLESTLESAVMLELESTSEGRNVHSSEVNAAIDADVSADAREEYRDGEAARDSIVARLAASVKAASEARAAFLAAADSQYQSRRSAIESARVEAEAEFDAALHAAANDTAAARAAQRAYLNAMVRAYVDADVQRTTFARSAEASYHAMVRASAQLSDSSRTAVARNYARILAVASDTAMRDEFRDAGASQARLQLVAEAGTRFRSSVDTASSRSRIDSAMVRFRSDVKTAFNDSADTTFNLFANVVNNLTVVAWLDSASTSFLTAINASANAMAVGEAYAESHAEAKAELLTRFQAVNDDDEEAEAAANLSAFLSVRTGLN